MHPYIYKPDCFEFEAEVVSCEQCDEGFKVILSESYFFPEAGGQPSDKGFIGDIEVLRVMDTKPIIHILKQSVQALNKAKCVVDKQFRMENSRQHTGQHLLSALAEEMFGAQSSSFKISSDLSTIELDKKLDEKQIQQLQRRINEKIMDNLEVQSTVIENKQEIPENLRKSYDFVPLRLVTIKDTDQCPCCGTHVKQLGQLGMCKIYSSTPLKGGVKLFFCFGLAAYEQSSRKDDLLKQLCQQFTCGEEILVQNITNLKLDLKATTKKLDLVLKLMLPGYLQEKTLKINGFTLCSLPFLLNDLNMVLQVLNQNAENAEIVIVAQEGAQATVMIYSKAGKAEELSMKMKSALKCGKCGGNKQRQNLQINQKIDQKELEMLLTGSK